MSFTRLWLSFCKAGVPLSGYLTWFQGNEACRASGQASADEQRVADSRARKPSIQTRAPAPTMPASRRAPQHCARREWEPPESARPAPKT